MGYIWRGIANKLNELETEVAPATPAEQTAQQIAALQLAEHEQEELKDE